MKDFFKIIIKEKNRNPNMKKIIFDPKKQKKGSKLLNAFPNKRRCFLISYKREIKARVYFFITALIQVNVLE